MPVILWTILAVLAVFGILWIAVQRAQRRLPPLTLDAGETLTPTALQQSTRGTLIACLALAVCSGGIVLTHGAQAFWDIDRVRLWVTALNVAILGVFAVHSARVGRWVTRDDGTLDERDRSILATAAAGQGPALLVTLAAWTIGLTEAFHVVGTVPTYYLYLVFWSCLIVNVLAALAGVMLGYRRS